MPSKYKLHDFFPDVAIRSSGAGVEVEVEAKGEPLPKEIGGIWLSVKDDSLRGNSREYITRQPLPSCPKKRLSHLKKLTDVLDNPLYLVDKESKRTSVHVHRNVQTFSVAEIWTTVLAYWMLEDPLACFYGKERNTNIFSSALSSSEGIIAKALDDILAPTPFISLEERACKYGGQNISTIARLGTIEYRAMEGNIDAERINKWVSLLTDLGDNARKIGTPDKLFDLYMGTEKNELIVALLGEENAKLLEKEPNYVGLIRNNVQTLANFAYAKKDWNQYEDSLEALAPKPKQKKVKRRRQLRGLRRGIVHNDFEAQIQR